MRNKFLGTGEQGYHPIRKIKVCISGLRYAVQYDFSVAYKVFLSLLTLIVCFVFNRWIDSLLLIGATGLMIIAEMFNSAIEALCDFVEAHHNERIKIIKDISAAATGIAIMIWAMVLIVEFSRIWRLLFP